MKCIHMPIYMYVCCVYLSVCARMYSMVQVLVALIPSLWCPEVCGFSVAVGLRGAEWRPLKALGGRHLEAQRHGGLEARRPQSVGL